MKTSLTMLMVVLPGVAAAAGPAFRDNRPLDFCLEVVSRLNHGEPAFLSDRIDLGLAYDMSLNALPIPQIQKKILSSEGNRGTIVQSMRERFATVLAGAKLTGGWRLADAEETWPERSTCRLVFTEEGDVARVFGLQLQLRSRGDDFQVTDVMSSYYNRPYSTLVNDTLKVMVSLTSDPAIGVQAAYDRPWLEAYMAAVNHNQRDEIIRLYESAPYPALSTNLNVLDRYLGALYAREDARRKFHERLLDVTGKTPSSVLASYLIDEHRKADFSLMTESFEKNYGYSPGLGMMRLLANQSWGDKREVFRSFAEALARDDRDDSLCWTMFTFLVTERRYREALVVMDALKARFGYDFSAENLRKSAVFNDLLQSADYLDWIAKQQHPAAGG